MAMPVFADLNSDGVLEDETPGTVSMPITFTKILQMPIFTTTPEVTFTFTVSAVGYSPLFQQWAINDEDDEWEAPVSWVPYAAGNMPYGSVTYDIDFVAGDIGTSDRTTGLKQVVKEYNDGKTPAGYITFDAEDFNAPGLYVYRVTETSDFVPTTDPYEDWMTLSLAEYQIEVWVMEDAEGDLYIAAVGTIIYQNVDEWWEENDGEEGDKIDPTPGGGWNYGETVESEFSQMVFTNKYLKNNGGEDPDPEDPNDPTDNDTVFYLKKLVAGNGADQGTYFAFNVTLTQPTIVGVGPNSHNPRGTYKAYIMDDNGIVQDITANLNEDPDDPTPIEPDGFDSTGPDTNPYILFNGVTPVARTIYLKGGQWLAFVDAEVGSKIAVTETGVTDYKASYTLVLNGGAPGNDGSNANEGAGRPLGGGTFNGTASDFGASLGFPPYGMTSEPAFSGWTPAYIGEPLNYATFTNTYRTITPTGIAVDNLPFYVLIGAAVIALIAYIAVRARRNAKYYEQYRQQ
jgi:hypothetical protein